MPSADTIRPGCKDYAFSSIPSSRDISPDQPHGGRLHLALDTGDLFQATSSGLIRSRPFFMWSSASGNVPMRPFAKLSARQWDVLVSLDDYDKAPFAFNGTIGTTKVAYPRRRPSASTST